MKNGTTCHGYGSADFHAVSTQCCVRQLHACSALRQSCSVAANTQRLASQIVRNTAVYHPLAVHPDMR